VAPPPAARASEAQPPEPTPDEEEMTDAVTRLPSRALFLDRVRHALARAQRRQLPVAVMRLALDELEGLVERAGGEARSRDQILGIVATRLETCLRISDTAARLGPSDFGVLLETPNGDADFGLIADRVSAALATPVRLGDREVVLQAVIALARAQPGDTADELLAAADLSLADARRAPSSVGTVAPDNVAPPAAAVERLALERDFRIALETRALSLHYQPIVVLQNRRIVGVEALLRWEHPTRGAVPPSVILPIADELGLTPTLGAWVLERACVQARHWQDRIGARRSLTITVNVSTSQLRAAGFVDLVARTLRSSGLDPHRLVLEVSDGVAASPSPSTFARLQSLKALGLRIAIDQFGTRQLSLQQLPGFPVDILKIDRSFVERVSATSEEASFAEVVVALGRSLRLRTVASGVEHEGQVAELLRIRCEFGQGALFSRPLTAAALEDLLMRDQMR
jgi:diguanylate cyclase (GGDEF)-like protein